MLRRAIVATVAACIRRPWVVLATAVMMGGIALVYTMRHIAIDTDNTKLLSSDLPWRQREIAFDAAFPQRVNQIVMVVDYQNSSLHQDACRQ